ncbi:hypothetical protein GCM10010472_60880 [Pseudonocardia halophobica]|uniref:Uncharacterized protein n=1 Tax=Pseudonocardia halophobica TaxID=29401 RepID=A0A9W6NYU1_9PSEU|nr:hypothetical protein GCM10017577_53810 [Pseudonocardia halophobica]
MPRNLPVPADEIPDRGRDQHRSGVERRPTRAVGPDVEPATVDARSAVVMGPTLPPGDRRDERIPGATLGP